MSEMDNNSKIVLENVYIKDSNGNFSKVSLSSEDINNNIENVEQENVSLSVRIKNQNEIISGKNNFSGGEVNTTEGNNNFLCGENNKQKGDNNIICGANNILEASNSILLGNGNINSISGNNSFIIGQNNKNSKINSIVCGGNNIANGNNTAIFGSDNYCVQNYSFIVGTHNSITAINGEGNILLGNRLIGPASGSSHTLTIGRFNKQDEYIFAIGAGSSEDNRKNNFVVKENSLNVFDDILKIEEIDKENYIFSIKDALEIKNEEVLIKKGVQLIVSSGSKILIRDKNDEETSPVRNLEFVEYQNKQKDFNDKHNRIENLFGTDGAIYQIIYNEADNRGNGTAAPGSKGSIVFGGYRADEGNISNLKDIPHFDNSNDITLDPYETEKGRIKNIIEEGRFLDTGLVDENGNKIYKFKNIISGTTTYAEAVQAFVVGAGNRVYGNWSAAGGKDNVVIGKSGLIFGNGNVIASPGYNKGEYSFSFVVGSSNISAENGTHSLVMGENNTNLDSHSLVGGKGNLNKGRFSVVLGGGDTSGYVPFRNHNLADNGFIFGKGNIIEENHNGSILLGESLKSTNENSTIVGKNSGNAVIKYGKLRFAVGTGSTPETGTNGFEVYEGGVVRVYRKPENENEVARRKEIDDLQSKINELQKTLEDKITKLSNDINIEITGIKNSIPEFSYDSNGLLHITIKETEVE